MTRWVVYLLVSEGRTYVGATTNVTRRLRQHNGEITGGARATHRRRVPWSIAAVLGGFADKRSALRWERIIKCRARAGAGPRLRAMADVARGVCPAGRRGARVYDVPPDLVLTECVPL